MKDNIFSNFYAKVLSFFTAQKDDADSARNAASNRLKLVLLQDRSNLDGATMQKMREQLINVISKYIEIDTDALDLNLEGDGDEIALMLNIPVIRARTPEEIEEIEAQEKAEKENTENNEETSEEETENTENNEEQSEENNEAEAENPEENSESNTEHNDSEEYQENNN